MISVEAGAADARLWTLVEASPGALFSAGRGDHGFRAAELLRVRCLPRRHAPGLRKHLRTRKLCMRLPACSRRGLPSAATGRGRAGPERGLMLMAHRGTARRHPKALSA